MFEELLHIAALSHLSTSIKRELASIIVFESHAQAGTICKYCWVMKIHTVMFTNDVLGFKDGGDGLPIVWMEISYSHTVLSCRLI